MALKIGCQVAADGRDQFSSKEVRDFTLLYSACFYLMLMYVCNCIYKYKSLLHTRKKEGLWF